MTGKGIGVREGSGGLAARPRLLEDGEHKECATAFRRLLFFLFLEDLTILGIAS